eukprot:4942221-Pyramimonas_sp.AAC.1
MRAIAAEMFGRLRPAPSLCNINLPPPPPRGLRLGGCRIAPPAGPFPEGVSPAPRPRRRRGRARLPFLSDLGPSPDLAVAI